jgi:Spy/CpxP family protein refolding chaperone
MKRIIQFLFRRKISLIRYQQLKYINIFGKLFSPNKMKKISTILAFVVAMMAFSTNIHAQGMDPQVMIQRQVERMTTELSLSKDQVAKIEPLIEARMNKMMELRQQGMEREEMMAEMKKINDAQAEQFKAILTPEQLEKYKTMQNQTRQGGPPRN